MKRIYMAQPNSRYGDSVYFPYAVGSLIAYAFEDAGIREGYTFGGFFYKKESPELVVSAMEKPFLIGFSCYVWNYEYNKRLAAAVKNRWPDCITVFGGHQVYRGCDIIQNSNVDLILFGEGEESFKRILFALNGRGLLSEIPNIMYRRNGAACFTKEEAVCIPERVSPYLNGWFDELLQKERSVSFSAILETNRGCPNRCAFCDWGNIKSRVHLYDAELVKKEINWFAEHSIEYLYAADANYGLFPRDEIFIDYLIQRHAETGFPQKFQATYSKNNPETVFRLNKKLNEAGMSKGATLSFQSMSSEVLDNIYRKNMPLERFQQLMRLYHANGISAYSELILGLPGETYESFREGLEELLENGQHMSINIFNCELLNNSIMNDPEYMQKYGIRTVKIEQHQYHIVPYAVQIPEYSNIVVSTDALPESRWIDSNILGVFVRAFHNLGLLQCFAIYLYYEQGLRYMDFYERLIDFAKQNPKTVIGRMYLWLRGKYKEILTGRGSLTWNEAAFGNLTWPLEEAAFLIVMKDLPQYCEEIRDFLRPFFPNLQLFEDLVSYQFAVVKIPGAVCLELNCQYDWFSFFMNVYQNLDPMLKKIPVRYRIDPGEISAELPVFARNTIWFGRRGSQNIVENIVVV